jgi:hypothetical protein
MKKLFLYAAAFGFLFASCQKDESNEATPNNGLKPTPTPVVSPVPSTFVKKVMIEEFTSTTNGDCPESADLIYSIVKGSSNRIYHASLHSMDVMAGPQTNRMMTVFTPMATTIPCASIDRIRIGGSNYLNTAQYKNAVNSLLSKPASCGLAIRSNVGKSTTFIEVHAGFKSNAMGNYKVTTYLVEDVIINGNPAYFQDNASNGNPTSNFFNMGNPIVAFPHKNVVRKVLSADLGDVVTPQTLANGSTSILYYEIDTPNKMGSSSTWKIISFITDATTNEVLNVQMGDLGSLKNWN